jgi:FkbM family methyltransferase
MGSTMIVNRFDYSGHADGSYGGAGVGISLLERGSHEEGETELVAEIALHRRRLKGDGVIMIDGGANIGSHTIAWARLMEGWGKVFAFEAQERTYYALAGNIAINNCFNAAAGLAALTNKSGSIAIPRLDHTKPANFGGLSLTGDNSKVGQELKEMVKVPAVAIDDMKLHRLDILKLDIEGMEPLALAGAQGTIQRLRPIVFAEWTTCGNVAVARHLPGYDLIPVGMNMLAIHPDDPVRKLLRVTDVGLKVEDA